MSEKEDVPAYANINEAMAAFQGMVKNPAKTKTADVSKFKYKYADIADVLEAILPIMAKCGLSLTQPTVIRDGAVILETVIAHVSGGTIKSEYPVCSINGNHQAMGSALTYARRYALTSLIGVAAVEDTDGAGAAPSGEGQRVKMSAYEARKEVDWEAVQNAIDTAPNFAAVDKREERVKANIGSWPDSWVSSARERIQQRRMELAEIELKKCADIDELSDKFAGFEIELHNKVNWEELSAIYAKIEAGFQDRELI